MSNRRRLRAPGPDTRDRCSACSRRIGKLDSTLRLRTGQVICPACQQNGDLPRCPSCRAYCLPGSFIVRHVDDRINIRCQSCDPDNAVTAAGGRRLGLTAHGGY